MGTHDDSRSRLGAWYTPTELVAHVVGSTLPERYTPGQVVTVLDPACGDGRFLSVAADSIRRLGGIPVLTGIDISPEAIEAAHRYPGLRDAELICADALSADALAGLAGRRWDVVLGNPPFLSPLSAQVRADAAHRDGEPSAGGQYADSAVEFLSLAVRVANENGGRVGFVLPLSVLGSRDAGPVREEIDAVADIRWLWWSPSMVFDAQVFTCAVGLVRRGRRGDVARTVVTRTIGPDFTPMPACELPSFDVRSGTSWAELIADDMGVPALPDDMMIDGELVDRARANADFRDQYYGIVDAVLDAADTLHAADAPHAVDAPDAVDVVSGQGTAPLVTTGLIDPGICRWGSAPVRYAKQRFVAPVVVIDRLTPELQDWVRARRKPKVMVATQTSIIEAVADPTGHWLPAVPVISVSPHPEFAPDEAERTLWEIAAVLTSPVASAFVARRAAGTGMSARVVRVTARHLHAVPWPAGDLGPAVAAIRVGDVLACGAHVVRAYGVTGVDADALLDWWGSRVRR
jgi:hypothetical protein